MTFCKEDVVARVRCNGEVILREEVAIYVAAVGYTAVVEIFEGIKAYCDGTDNQLCIFDFVNPPERFLVLIKKVRFGFPYTAEEIFQAIQEVLRANEHCRAAYIRLRIFQQGMEWELLQAEPVKPTQFVIHNWAFASYKDPSQGLHVGASLRAHIADTGLPQQPKCLSGYHVRDHWQRWRLKVSGGLGSVLVDRPRSGGNHPTGDEQYLGENERARTLAMTVIARVIDCTELYLLNSNSIGAIGVSEKPGLGRQVARKLWQVGCHGRIYSVTPKYCSAQAFFLPFIDRGT